MSITPQTLTGVSKYSADLQSILTRAFQIAQIPITQLQNKDSDLIQRKTLLSGIQGAAATFSASLTSLGTVAQNQAVSATSSNAAVVTAVATGATSPGSYTINSVTSAASAASERTNAHFADSSSTPVATSATATVNLVVGTKAFKFDLANNTLIGLRDKINSLPAGVNASILTTTDGNYLSLSATATGEGEIQLFDDPDNPAANTNLLTSGTPGSDAVFKLNNIDIRQPGNVVNSVIPGLTFTIKDVSATPVTLNLASDTTQLSSSLQSFVDNYNALSTQLKAQVGASAGLLSGDTAVTQLQSLLRQVSSYRTTTGSVKSLADLGIELSNTGVASFNQTTFSKLSGIQISDAFGYLGSAGKGLAGFSSSLKQYSDPISGLLKIEQNGIDATDKHLQSQILTLADRVNVLQASLTARLQAVDTLLATLQSQQSTVSASLQSLNFVLYGKAPNS